MATPPYWKSEVQKLLDRNFPDCWIGQADNCGQIPRPNIPGFFYGGVCQRQSLQCESAQLETLVKELLKQLQVSHHIRSSTLSEKFSPEIW